MIKSALFFLFVVLNFTPLYAQEDSVQWKRSEEAPNDELHLFRSTQVVNLPTAECLQAGDWEFEISHRFIPTIKSGSEDFWGFDGPVNMRIALGYAITDNSIITLGRSNLNDNVDLQVKYFPIHLKSSTLPVGAAIRLGVAWNTEELPQPADASDTQFYAQLIINTMYKNRLGIGVVPSYVYNSYIFTDDTQYSFTMGTYVQYYVSELLGLLIEWNPTVTGFRVKNNPVAFGIELNTGGHFFKIILTNSSELNSSQFLSGTSNSFNNGEWHIGFNITRLLSF